METIQAILKPTAESPAAAQRQYILNLILLGLVAPGLAFMVIMGVMMITGHAPVITVVVAFTMQPFYLLAYVLGRRERITLAAWVVVLTLIAAMTLTATYAGLGHITSLGMVIAVLIAGAMNGLGPAVISSLLNGALYALVGYAQLRGWITNPIPPTVTILPEAVGTALASITLALLAHFSTREMHKATLLQASWAQYQMTFDAMEDLIIVIDDNERIVLCNAAACDGFQRASLGAEIIGQPMTSAGPFMSDAVIDAYHRALAHHQVQIVETTINLDDGAYQLDVRQIPTTGTDDDVHVIIVMRDVTARQRAEAALRESEEKLRHIVENSTILFYAHTPDHELTYLSPQTRTILDCEPEEAMVRWTELATDNPINQIGLEITEKAIATGKAQPPYEVELLSKTGRKIWGEVHEAPVVQDGKTIAIVGSLTDITERKRAEAALRASEARARALLQAIPDMMFRLNREGVYLDYKAAHDELYVQDVETIIGKHNRNLITPAFANLVEHNISQTLATNEMQVFEYQLPVPNRGMHHYEARMVPSGPDEVITIVRDITKRKETETALHQTMERLRIQHDIDTAILVAQSKQEIMRATLERLHHLVPCRHASISEIDSTQALARETMIVNHNGIQMEPIKWHPTSDAGPDLFTAMHQGRPYVIQDIAAQENPTPLERAIATAGLRAYISVPLTGPDGPIGTLNLGSERPNFFQPDHVEILEEVATSLSVALQQAHLLEQTRQDAETKAMLLREVNHRVKNNLDTIVGLLYIERRHASPEAMVAYQPIMHDLTNRIVSLARVHDMLSATGWMPLKLHELAERIIGSIAQTTPHKMDVTVTAAQTAWVTPNQAHYLALILSELTTNTSKYAVAGREEVHIALDIAKHGAMITLTYRNDGPDYPEEVLRLERYSAGLEIIQEIVRRNLQGAMALRNDGGAVTEIVFEQKVSA